ncbi:MULTISPECIES: hypothetical protein [unclassified Acinetobacter]|uniref:hypothetical protein n=1 Tax=unclassified Acinetobacter TaxID=196816 RepID=UPI0015D1CCAC|nr:MULTISPECIES: hypothetical protein [unclassified Acinetobacter]
MAQIKAKFQFRKSYLAMMIGLGLLPSAHAMQELSDSSLSDTTGEGVALVLDDFKMVFQAPNDASSGSSYARGIANPGQADTGFIRIIPTGENYAQLGERAYNKTYDLAYTNAYLGAQASTGYATIYKDTYDPIFNPKYTELETKYTKDIKATEEAKQPALRSQLVQAYYDSELMQRYYEQRYDDYYNGAGNTSPGINYSLQNDGTTAYKLTPYLPNRSKEYAEINTREMIELLYGNKINNTLPESKFIKDEKLSTTGRTNIIDPVIDAYIASQIAQKTDAGKLQAKTEADALAAPEAEKKRKELYDQLIALATQAAKDAGTGASVTNLRTKADVFIYGLALSKSDGSLSTRYSDQGFSWGTPDNPWLFRAGSDTVKQFSKTDISIGYLALEAPLATVAANEADNNIKLGFWTDIFSRELNSSNEVDPVTGAPTSGLDKDYRLRAQFVANGLSLNGSQTRLFQTGKSTNENYNETLGIASIVRLNTNDNPANLSIDDQNLDNKGIRLSTAAKSDTLDGTAVTPAIDRSNAPIFNETEGLYLYSPNINLVLGNMYQPFILGSEGNNIILEITRIPNVPEVYNQIYQNYAVYNEDGEVTGYLGTDAMKGSTCNVYRCGTPISATADTVAIYQGRDATHSSIAIGTVDKQFGSDRMLKAKDGTTATGIVFKDVNGLAKNFGSAVIDGVLIQHLKIKTTGL